MIRKEEKIDQLIDREVKKLKHSIKSGMLPIEFISFDIFIENFSDDYQIDSAQIEYVKDKSRSVLKDNNVKIKGI
ncbi:hypothetical protein KMW28_10365 [Flammeovirga yaeyamensis]|uniref:Uncharacterized protein n=1 Tax=Flammeovirga yaeyamensis TaxID=367791 RepID=A0AAX1MXI7_9BACT|nr:hypothetical protein [Flammeovirga yaeyamensis]MBB3696442.1 hypothetical protein [Flammeovirga yaeyamensis]NMF35121.1 hypothetical protein [Flammeovirga yaeyamensis]QWG00059.1 hypothetical protein KMW28_10365 [Flammeovirga yaeyamensis]